MRNFLLLAIIMIMLFGLWSCATAYNGAETYTVMSEEEAIEEHAQDIGEERVNQELSQSQRPAPYEKEESEVQAENDSEYDAEETISTSEEEIFISTLIEAMSTEEKISQLFILSLGSKNSGTSESLAEFVSNSAAGGFILFTENITTVEGTRAFTDALNEHSVIAPFIAIDEEGGVVSRLRSAGLPGYTPQPTAREIGASGDSNNAYSAGYYIGQTLNLIGVNLNFAPVADVLTNPRSTVIGSRAFSTEPETVAYMASAFQAGLRSQGILSSPKHFPGHGNTADDSHFGRAIIASDIEHLRTVEFLPFERLIAEGAEFVMTGHLLVPEVSNTEIPTSLCEFFVTELLREELGFHGIIITDAMNMGAITDEFNSAEAAVLAILAGTDMILMPEDFEQAAYGILQAIEAGTISIERIEESLVRILTAKFNAGLLE